LYEEQQKRKMFDGIIVRFSVLDTFEHKEEVKNKKFWEELIYLLPQ
jgi:hypothetical protein